MFETGLVGNPGDRVSHNVAHFMEDNYYYPSRSVSVARATCILNEPLRIISIAV